MILTTTSRVFLILAALGALVFLPVYLPVEAQRKDNRELRVQEVKELPAKAKRYALVIGVDEYQDEQISRLSGATNDAKALAAALVRYAGFPSDQVILLASDQPQQRQPNRGNILQYLSNLRGIVPEDGLLLVSFAGHGIERGGRGFLCPSDARIGGSMALLESTAVAVDTVREWIRETGVKQVLIVLDACRNDPSGRGGEENRLTDSFAQRFNFDVRNREVTAFATLYATDVGHVAYEYKEKKQGYFTWALVEGLKGGAANGNGEVTLGGLVKYLQEQVPKRVRLDMGQEKSQKPYAIVGGYKADELVISMTAPASSVTLPISALDAAAIGSAIEIVRVPSGRFTMGSPSIEEGRSSLEGPQHMVSVSSFYMSKYEVTQAQWRAVAMRLPKVKIALNPDTSYFKGDYLPVEQVSWEQAIEFCDRLSSATGKTYRLPSEAEWEYACRAMTTGSYAGNLDSMGWYTDNSGGKTHPVGMKHPNGFGLYDMHGNVMEWCMDTWHENYDDAPTDGSAWSGGDVSRRVSRGGSWLLNAGGCRCADRRRTYPVVRLPSVGFRVVVAARTP